MTKVPVDIWRMFEKSLDNVGEVLDDGDKQRRPRVHSRCINLLRILLSNNNKTKDFSYVLKPACFNLFYSNSIHGAFISRV